MAIFSVANGNALTPGQITGSVAGTSLTAFPLASSASTKLALPVPGSGGTGQVGQFEQLSFRVKASGYVQVFGVSPTLKVALLGGTTAALGTTLVNLPGSAQSLTTSAAYPWVLEATMEGDSTSGIVQGYASLTLNNVLTASTALTTDLTGINFTNNPAFYLGVGLTFGVSNAGNVGNLGNFYLVSD